MLWTTPLMVFTFPWIVVFILMLLMKILLYMGGWGEVLTFVPKEPPPGLLSILIPMSKTYALDLLYSPFFALQWSSLYLSSPNRQLALHILYFSNLMRFLDTSSSRMPIYLVLTSKEVISTVLKGWLHVSLSPTCWSKHILSYGWYLNYFRQSIICDWSRWSTWPRHHLLCTVYHWGANCLETCPTWRSRIIFTYNLFNVLGSYLRQLSCC
jgi:hypothetical protein